ncbi:DUF6193 family natural product biosynthesis protein [Kitasatospora griseola]|uniref:DUF6193 family natural product biosynthesis protein n=1 Tax=Kitasatospora griseola TaxID=2064 RepID=UPI0036DB8054
MTNASDDLGAAEREAAAAAFGARLDQVAAELGLRLPAPEQLGRSWAEFRAPDTDDRAWIRTWVPDAGPAVSVRRAGVTLANGHAPDLAEAVRAAAAWLAGADLAGVRDVAPFLVVHDWAFAHERAPLDEVELIWRQDLGRFDTRALHRYPLGYRAMFEAAFAEPRLRRLAPVTSHYRLWFSAVPRFPFQPVGGAIDPLSDGGFLVRSSRSSHETVEVATAEQAVALVAEGLPAEF